MLGYFANKLSIRTIHNYSMTMLAHSDRSRINLYFDHSKDEKTNLAPQQLAPEKIIFVWKRKSPRIESIRLFRST